MRNHLTRSSPLILLSSSASDPNNLAKVKEDDLLSFLLEIQIQEYKYRNTNTKKEIYM